MAKFQLPTGSLFNACHCLKDSAPLQFSSTTFMSAHYLNFPFKILKNSQTLQLLIRLHQYFAFTQNSRKEEGKEENEKPLFQLSRTPDNLVTFQIIRFLLGSHEDFLILQNNKPNTVVIPHQVKSSLSPQHNSTSEQLVCSAAGDARPGRYRTHQSLSWTPLEGCLTCPRSLVLF